MALAGLTELRSKLEQKLPLNLTPEQIATLMKLGDEIESRGLGEDHAASRYTRITVNLTDAEPIPDSADASHRTCRDEAENSAVKDGNLLN